MAHFQQHANSTEKWFAAGEWSDTAVGPTLLVRLGEEAVFVLWGGADGGVPLRVTAEDKDGMDHAVYEDSRIPTGPNERAFWLRPMAEGEITVRAVEWQSLKPWAAPLRVVVLPREASAGTDEHVIVYGHTKDDLPRDTATQKRDNFAPNAVVFGSHSPVEFLKLLTRFRDSGRTIKKLEFIAHANRGLVALGRHSMNTAVIRSWEGRGLYKAFASDAAVFFHGCNVAEGRQGEAFLEAFAEVFLRSGGGRVSAGTARGYSWSFTRGKILHVDIIKRVIIDHSGRITKRENFGMDPVPAPPPMRSMEWR